MFPRIETNSYIKPLSDFHNYIYQYRKIVSKYNNDLRIRKKFRLPIIFTNNYNEIINQNISNSEENEEEKYADNDDIEEKVEIGDKENSSKLYINNVFNRKLYLLTFNPVNVRLQAIHLGDRIFEENANDKCTQSRSNGYFSNKFFHKNTKLNLVRKFYSIDTGNSRVSIMENKKPFMKARQREPAPMSKKRSISRLKSNIGTSVIYIKSQDLDFQLYPGILDLKLSRTNLQDQSKLLEELNMESTNNMKNKARFIVNHKNDILQFTFEIENINYNVVQELISRGIQVEDRNYYVNTISPVTNKVTYFSIPETTYDFEDQTKKLIEKNTQLKLNKLEPRWVLETRIKRIQEYKKCRIDDPYKNIWEIKVGSHFCYEDNGTVYKAKTGTIKCKVEDQIYEDWVHNLLRVSYKQPSKHSSPGNFDDGKNLNSNTPDGIPDWDLVVYRL